MARARRQPETATITAVTHDGRGIADTSGKKVFVAGALSGEEVRFQRRKSRRKFDEAELLEVITASPSSTGLPASSSTSMIWVSLICSRACSGLSSAIRPASRAPYSADTGTPNTRSMSSRWCGKVGSPVVLTTLSAGVRVPAVQGVRGDALRAPPGWHSYIR